ncbi:MAG: carboxypeptidase regulatory-like domain-containing protein [Terracidiphilus sp.]|jgi:hypothetical protein
MSEYLQSGQHPDADQIGAFVEHALPAHERERMFNHLAVCPECRAIAALSLPPIDEPAKPLAASARKPWWSGWTFAWPAAAAVAALTVVVFFIHRAAVVPSAPASSQIASSHLPAPPAPQEQLSNPSAKPLQGGSPAQPANANHAASAGAVGLEAKQIPATEAMSAQLVAAPRMQDRKVASLNEAAQAQVNLPAESPEQNARFSAPLRVVGSSGVGGGLAKASSAAAEDHPKWPAPTEPAGTAVPSAPPASAPAATAPSAPSSEAVEVSSAAPIETVSTGAANAVLAAEEAQPANLKYPLPSGLPVLSIAAQARLMVAIDTRNAVFLSRDDGRHWKAIRAQWQGRAVRANLVGFPVVSRTSFCQDREAGAVALRAADAAPAENVNEAVGLQGRSLSARPGSSLMGTVTDRTGAVVPGATVAVTDTVAHTVRTIRTDSAGRYVVDGLAPGTYRVEARSPGFKTETLAAVAVAASQPAVANLSLTIGATTQTVTVSSAPPIETETLGASAMEISASKKVKATPATPSQPTSVFEIVTDNGERWTSADGLTWKRM